MNKFITKQGSRLAALAAGIVLFSFTATAQDLINSKKVNNAGGTIKFNSNAGTFENSAAIGLITNTGVIEMLGTDNTFTGTNTLSSSAALRVPGQVSYASPAAAQNVFPGYYTDLDMKDAGVKNFGAATSVFIGQNYTTAGGNRVYGTSLITYDGAAAQAVAAENATNGGGYNNLDFTEAGLKTLSVGAALVNGTTGIDASTTGGGLVVDGTSGATLTATGDLTQDAGAGDLSLISGGVANVNGAANTIGANAVVTNGTLNLGDGAIASATTVTGTLSLTGATGILAANALSTLNVDGGFTNTDATRTNQTFAANSTIDYQDGASNIVTTASTNPYGAFIISKSNGPINAIDNGGTEIDLEIATSFAMSGGSGNNLDMLGSTGGKVNLTSGTAGNVTYAGNEEVVGTFRRSHNITAGDTYVFNNAQTKANFTTKPTDAAANYFEVYVNPDGQTQYYDATRDVQRDIRIDYNYDTWVADITAGYQATDVPLTWDPAYDEDQIRFREGKADGTQDEKVSTGEPYARTGSGVGSLGYVTLPGMTATATDVDGNADAGFFADASAPHNELILRAGPAIWYSVNPGRWSNPLTWDEGIEPPTDVEVVVRHNVHAGFIRADGYAIDEDHPTLMATKITIMSPDTDPLFPTPTLMIGSSDITAPFATSTTPVAGITNPGRIIVEGVTTEVPVTGGYAAENTGAAVNFVAGLVVFGGADITASESLINDGCLNIGGTLGIGQ